MEFVVQVQGQEELAAALASGAGAVAVPLPRSAAAAGWPALKESRAAARQRGVRFYLTWDRLVPEQEFIGARHTLAAAAELAPDALALRDLGICREARQHYPRLRLHLPGNWGAHNSPALDLAEKLGYRRVVVEAPLGLKDLALMRRQSSMSLEVALSPYCRGFPGLCLLNEYLGRDCASCGGFLQAGAPFGGSLLAAVETLGGLCQLGVEAVRLRADLVPPEFLTQAVDLFQTIGQASPGERPQVVAAAREIIAAFGDRFLAHGPGEANISPPPVPRGSPERPSFSRSPGRGWSGKDLWLEPRGYGEAAALAPQWRHPLAILLTPENYAAFLAQHRLWGPGRLVWRLPSVVRETALPFYQKALETLGQGGYRRFIAGDWGAVALVRAAGGDAVLGDQTLGIRNSQGVKVARHLGVSKVCLPPGAILTEWRELLSHAGPENFWTYLFHVPALAVFSRDQAVLPPIPDSRARLRWAPEGDVLLLCPREPEDLMERGPWLRRQGVAPLVVSLPRSGLPRGRLPGDWLHGLKPRGPRRG